MSIRLIKSIALGLTLFSVAACNQHFGPYGNSDTQLRNVVNHVRLTENIDVSNSATGLSTASARQINLFLRINNVGYGDKISIDLGEQTNANAKREAVRKHLNSVGLKLEDRAPITGPKPQENRGILVVDRFIVTPPNCHGNFSQGNSMPITVTSPTFGCSHQVNLGLMVANPQDLVDPQQTAPTNAEVAVSGVGDYRNGSAAKGTQITSPLSGGSTTK